MKKLSAFLVLVLTVGLFNVPLSQSQVTPDGPFKDVQAAPLNFNADAITKLKQEGVLKGYADQTFRPTATVNRAEFAAIIARAIVQNPTGKNCFSDVKMDWSAPYICELKTRGILSGYSDGTFRGSDPIKFSEASKVISKAYKLKMDTTNNKYWYEAPIKALAAKKAIPLSVDFFDKETTRGEMAEMIWRLKDNIENKSTRSYEEITGQQLVTVSSCPDLKSRYEELQFPQGYGADHGYDRDVIMFKDGAMMPPQLAAPVPAGVAQPQDNAATISSSGAKSESSAQAPDHSTTNIQVQGVDEADIIKNDGKYIYLVKGKTIRIVEAYPAENLKELVTVELGQKDENFYPKEMYVDGDRLMVIGNTSVNAVYPVDQAMSMTSKIMAPYYYRSQTEIFVLNITDHSKPVIERSVIFDGSYNSSRKVGNNLYMVMNYYPSRPYLLDASKPWDFEAKDILPMMKDSFKGSEEIIAPCNQIRILPKPQQFNFIITAAIPLNDKTQAVSRSVVVGNSENIYASQNNLYVASTDWGEGYYRPSNDYGTAIYQFGLGNGKIEYKNRGTVPGTILNQFSMDEDKGFFRIATTKSNYSKSGQDVTNNLYVLDNTMKKVGSLENVAPGESIYSTRFMGDRGYMVTFKQIDPLFVIDLKDPSHPKIAGELKIPGYSTYLHPYDENHLIGFGNDVDETIDADKVHSDNAVYYTAVQGLKMGLFDVTNINSPKEMFHEIIGVRGTTSELLNNHKALLFDKNKNLLAFPVSVTAFEDQSACLSNTYATCPASCSKVCVPSSCSYENGVKVCTSDCNGAKSCTPPTYVQPKTIFDGAYVYNIDLQNGFQLKGKITHYNDQDATALKEQGYPNYQKTIQRVLYIGENLYTVSMSAVKANTLSDLSEKRMTELAGGADDINYYGKPGVVPMAE